MAYPSFPALPTEGDILRARVFSEPLVPVGGETSVAENRALADAITRHARGGQAGDVSSYERFLGEHPDSAWRASLLANLGSVYRNEGRFQRAFSAWEEES